MEIGFIGIGQMGLPMASRLLDADHSLVVYDARASAMRPLLERQATQAKSACDVADRATVVFVSLPNNDASREALLGAQGLIHGQAVEIFVNTCTTGSPFAREMAAALASRNITTLESPISGGPPGARAGTLSIMVSGPRSAYDRVAPLLEPLGKTITFCGEGPGLAQVTKLANNILSASALIASVEALAMAVKAGVDPEVALTAINAGSGRNSATEDKIPRDVLTGQFNYGAAIHILMKDIDLALAEGEAQGVPQMVCSQVRQMFKLAMHMGWAERDITELARLVESWSDCEIRSITKQ